MARPCPDCGAQLAANGSCGSCGYGRTNSSGKPVDPDWRLCADVFHGQRCGEAGSVSLNTRGGGPWLCWRHFTRSGPMMPPSAPPQGFQPIRDLVKRAVPDAELDAERAAIQNEPTA